MKTKLFLTLLVALLTISSSYASFPVKRTTANAAETEVATTEIEVVEPLATVAAQDKWVGVALWFFLGWPFAAHRWYYKKPVGWNILFILTIGGLGIWAIVDLINILTDNF